MQKDIAALTLIVTILLANDGEIIKKILGFVNIIIDFIKSLSVG
jgi:hypothetical protein